mgnify:FL=1|jgi:hypothetical protein
MNYRVRKLQRVYKERYEKDFRPTMRQIKVIKRHYVVYRKSNSTIDKKKKS